MNDYITFIIVLAVVIGIVASFKPKKAVATSTSSTQAPVLPVVSPSFMSNLCDGIAKGLAEKKDQAVENLLLEIRDELRKHTTELQRIQK